jgi:trans-aconitate 2-methyltransferase
VIAVDGSAAMIEQARERLDPARTTLIHSDLLALALDEDADAVFSNAVFHWLEDHRRLFGVLHSALRSGGRLEAQCGGEGNVARFYAAMEPIAARAPNREHLEGFAPTHFAGPAETEALLAEAGFEGISCSLESRPTRPGEPREFVRAVCIGAHAEQLPEELREPFLDEVLEALGPDPEFDYVRLNISARKGAAPA